MARVLGKAPEIVSFLIICLCACGEDEDESRTVKLRFLSGEFAYSVSSLRGMGVCNVPRDKGAVLIELDRSLFDKILCLCSEEVGNTPDIAASAFYSLAHGQQNLKIESTQKRLFFRNLGEKGLLGKHVGDILEYNRDAAECEALSKDTCFALLCGFLSEYGMEVWVDGDAAHVCRVGSRGKQSPGEQNCHALTKMLVHSSARSIVREDNLWEVLWWFFKHLSIFSLSLEGLDLDCLDPSVFSCMRLRSFGLRRCTLPQGWLSTLADQACELRNTLVDFDLSSTNLSVMDIEVVTGLPLQVLNIQYCISEQGSIAGLFVDGSAIMETLHSLSVSFNNLTEDDVVGISKFKLHELLMGNCSLLPGYLTPLKGSILKLHLKKLDLSDNRFKKEDIDTLCQLRVEELCLHHCNLRQGYLQAFGKNNCAFRGTLRWLDVSSNHFDDSDMAAIASHELVKLDVFHCDLEQGHLAAFGGDCALRPTLLILDASTNKWGLEDMAILAGLRLKALSLVGCRLAKGSFVAFGQPESVLKSTLESLVITDNEVGHSDTAAIARMRVKKLVMAHCSIVRGDLVPLGSSTSVAKVTLQTLNISMNMVSVTDTYALSKIAIVDLNMSFCDIEAGCLAPFGSGSAVIKGTLRNLNTAFTEKDEADDAEQSQLRNMGVCT